MNKARLEWHKERQRSTAEYIRAKNGQAMREWTEDWAGVDRQVPEVLEVHAQVREAKGVRLLHAVTVLDTERRQGALNRAGRLLREADAMKARATALRAGQRPLDEWMTCRCGGAFQPGERGYTLCWNCSSKGWIGTSFACVFCDRRHSMSYPTCFSCKQLWSEDDARFVRLMVNRRDNYVCAMCGIDSMETGAELQVDHVIPIEIGGTNDVWNLQTLCTPCEALKGKSYDKHDERAYFALVQAYAGPLFDYLSPDEQALLLAIEPETEYEQIDFGHVPPWRTDDQCSERDGLLNVVSMLGAVVA